MNYWQDCILSLPAIFAQATLCVMLSPNPISSSDSKEDGRGLIKTDSSAVRWKIETLGIFALAGVLVYFLKISWRKWPDPIVDFGQQCYAIWRVSQGAALYHDFTWSYGPVSVYFNALLFRYFGPGIMVLAWANLVIYGLILALSYVAFRRAWGRLGAFAASAVFISVFSFSHLLGVGNYNYVTPYAAESVHGMLLILIAAFVVARWSVECSRTLAFWFGLCGGVATVMKPEFMLAIGMLGVLALGLRWRQRRPVSPAEWGSLFVGAVTPTIGFTLWFARSESWKAAFIDASQAWWLVVVKQVQRESGQQLNFSGLDHPWGNVLIELQAAFWAALAIAAIWAAGWLVNRAWSPLVRVVTSLAALALVWFVRLPGGWFMVGRCLPGLMVIVAALAWLNLRREKREQGSPSASAVMRVLLVALAVAMLARMPLFARIFHLGFFQAALAGMVVAAVLVTEVPRWTGVGIRGRSITTLGCAVVLSVGCASIAAKSWAIRRDQTEPVGWGRDRFYATVRSIEGTGALVNWAAEYLRPAPANDVVVVLPEGSMINYLSRHKALEPGWEHGGSEQKYLERLRQNPPEYIVIIRRDLSEFGVKLFGTPGNFGRDIVLWVANNYSLVKGLGGDPLVEDAHSGAIIMQRRHSQ